MNKVIITFVLIFLFFDLGFGQNQPNEKLILSKNYYKINKKQKDIVKFYLLAEFYYPFGKIRSYDKMYWLLPNLIAIDKEGKILDFNSYQMAYEEADKYKKEFSINLFYLDSHGTTTNNEFVTSYTVLEPDWENVIEVNQYKYKKECPVGCEEIYELPIRKLQKSTKIKKFNQKFKILYWNDYE